MTDRKDRFDDPHLHRALQALTSIKAPERLIPDTLSLVRRRQSAWYRRPATTWPWPFLSGLILAGLTAFAGIVWGTIEVLPILQAIDLRELFAVPLSRIESVSATFGTMIRAATVLGRTAIAPSLLILTAVGSLFYLILLGAGTALLRTAARVSD